MGKYINTNSKNETIPHQGKAKSLIDDGALLLLDKPTFQDNLVCVVDNGLFEAAAYCYNESEFQAFNDPQDFRFKLWLIYPHAKELAR